MKAWSFLLSVGLVICMTVNVLQDLELFRTRKKCQVLQQEVAVLQQDRDHLLECKLIIAKLESEVEELCKDRDHLLWVYMLVAKRVLRIEDNPSIKEFFK